VQILFAAQHDAGHVIVLWRVSDDAFHLLHEPLQHFSRTP